MTKAEKPQGRLMKRITCPDCQGRIRKIAEGKLLCVGKCGKTYEQMKLWEDENSEQIG